MASFQGIKHVLLDIEGTICSISFVKETLFPYALRALPTTLSTNWTSPELAPYISAFPSEHRASPVTLQAHIEDLTARDVKDPALKSLQGYLWESGYKSGAYSTPLFDDVKPQLRAWKVSGQDLAIYSSGSVFAQKLLFEHVGGDASGDRGAKVQDLRDLIAAWFDTVNAGAKTEGASYRKIANAMKWTPKNVLFLSDNVKEVDAATDAGMQTCLLEREGNAPLTADDRKRHPVVQRLDQLVLAGNRRSARLESKAKNTS